MAIPVVPILISRSANEVPLQSRHVKPGNASEIS